MRTIVLVIGLEDKFAERYVGWGRKHGVNVMIARRGLQYGSGGIIREVVLEMPLLLRYGDFWVTYADSIFSIDFSRIV